MTTQMDIFDVIEQSDVNVFKKYNSLFVEHAKDARKTYKITSLGGEPHVVSVA